jgi:hypothetical protein
MAESNLEPAPNTGTSLSPTVAGVDEAALGVGGDIVGSSSEERREERPEGFDLSELTGARRDLRPQATPRGAAPSTDHPLTGLAAGRAVGRGAHRSGQRNRLLHRGSRAPQ